MKFFISIIFFISGLFALDLEFSVGENGKSLDDNNTVLIFGGIQGD
ncbi:deacylase, partial [Campylobacter coli]|nr:deacylase [Campylobacter coli]